MNIKKLVYTALCTALGIAIPSLFHLTGLQLGNALLPMHLPVLLCGLICGPWYGAVCGAAVPLLNCFVSGIPPLFPIALSMTFELAAYGAVSGLLIKRFNVFISLIGAMLAGRAVMGIVNAVLLSFASQTYGFKAFLMGAFVTALPGIVIQIVLIPLIIFALNKAGLIHMEKKTNLKTE